MSRQRFTPAFFGTTLWLWIGVDTGMTHPLNPALLEILESHHAPVEELWRVPQLQPTNAPLQPILPGRCTELTTPRVSQSGSTVSARWRMDCSGRSLVGERIGMDGLYERKTDALVRLHLVDGRLMQAVLRGDQPFLTVPERAGLLQVTRGYLALGFEHILTGCDHLLFVLGLVLLVYERRLLLWTITAFTGGHSITLSLAVLRVINIPPAPVEILIAGSIFVAAVELTRQAQGAMLWTRRWPWALAFAFGLLHGLGFAGALAQVGLPAGEIPLALFAFNVGIELGQLLFVGMVLLLRAALGLLPVRWPRISAMLPAYAIGTLAAFWVFERVWVLLPASP